MTQLDGKVAIVTGSGRGIGKGIARRYAAAGAKVVVASRTASTVDRVVEEIRAEGGIALGAPCDVGHQDQIQEMVRRSIAEFGPIDILVSTAQGFGTGEKPAGSPVPTLIEDYDDPQIEYSMRTGFYASYWAMKAVLPSMKDRGGRIINFGSEYGVMGASGALAYNATKEAIRALTRTAAREWGKYAITVNCINPVVATDGSAHQVDATGGAMDAVAQRVPLGRWGDPYKDAGGLALFLASEDSAYLTGMTFPLDGGLTIRA